MPAARERSRNRGATRVYDSCQGESVSVASRARRLWVQMGVHIYVSGLRRSARAAVVGATVSAVILACASGHDATSPGGSAASITVSPESSAVSVGRTTTLSAVARDASGNPISTASFFWSSSDTTIATVNQAGVVSGRNVGTAKIAASMGGVSGVAIIAVVGQPIAAVVVVPSSATLRINTTLQLSDTVKNAAGAPVPGQVVTWSSDNASVASVDAAAVVIARAAGTAHITGTVSTVSGTATITVTAVPIAAIVITPRDPIVFVQQTTQLTATPKDSAGNPLASQQVAWQSLASSVATVSATGVVTGISPGRAVIQASAEGVTGTDTVTITAAPVSSVVLSPSTSSLFAGQTEQLAAQVTNAAGQSIAGATVTYSSSNTAVAKVNASGMVTGVGVGITTITGMSQGKSGTAAVAVFSVPVGSVTVQPADTTIAPTGRAQMRVVVVDSLGHTVTSPTVTWSSTPAGRVSQAGLVIPLPGDTGVAISIVASSGAKSGSAIVNVSIPPPPAIASVTVQPADTTIAPTQSAQMRVVVTDVTGHVVSNAVVAWSTNPAGRVSATGLVTPQAIDAGTAITVTALSGGHSGTGTVNVSPAAIQSVVVQPADTTISAAQTAQMRDSVTDVNGHVVAMPLVVWTSVPVGRVSATGLVTPQAIDGGSAITVIATSGGQSGSATVNVTPAVPGLGSSVTVQPADTTITSLQTVQMQAVVTNGGGQVVNTPHVDWSSTPIGRITDDGLVTPTPFDVGSAITVVASSHGAAGTATVNVTAPLSMVPAAQHVGAMAREPGLGS